MNWHYTPYIIPLFLSAALALSCAAIVWRRHAGKEAFPLIVLMLSLAWWCVAYAFRLGSQTLELKIFWARVRYMGIVVVPAAWYAFVAAYTGRGPQLVGKRQFVLAIEPLVIILLVWTNGTLHNLIWTDIHLKEFPYFLGWKADHGVAFWIHTAYNYLLLTFSMFFLFQALYRSQPFYRRQIRILLMGATFPLFINILAVFNITPVQYLDMTPFAFTIGGAIFVWGIFRVRLMDIVPVAYDTILNHVDDGILVVDSNHRIVELNLAAACILNCQGENVIGHTITDVLAEWPEFIGEVSATKEIHADIALGQGDRLRHYELAISPLRKSQADFLGWCLVFHDITTHKQTEQALRVQKQLYQSLAAVARATTEQLDLEATLQNTLTVAVAISGADGGSLFILDDAFSVTHSMFIYGEPPSANLGEYTLEHVMSRGLGGWVARNRQSAVVYDVLKDERWVAVPTQRKTRSALSVPIMGRNKTLLGVLTLTSLMVGHFTDEHRLLMEAAAEQMALAWYNAQIYEDQLHLAKRLATLYEVLRTVGGELNPKSVPQIAVETIARLTTWPAVAILMPDDVPVGSGGAERLVVQAASSVVAVAHGWRVSARDGIPGRAFHTGESQYVSDLREGADATAANAIVRSRLAIPLRRGQRMLGVLDIGSEAVDGFSADARLLAELLAESVALALDVAQTHAQIGNYVADLSALFSISGVLSRSLVLEDLLTQTLSSALGAVGFDVGVVALTDADGVTVVAEQQRTGHETACTVDGVMQALCEHVHHLSRPVVVLDIEQLNVMPSELLDELPDLTEQFHKLGMRAYVGVPLLHQDRPIGVLSLFSRPSKPSVLHDIALLMAIGRQIATAVVNAQLFQAVEDERGRLFAVIESSRDGILFVDMRQNIVLINARALELLQLSESPAYWRDHALTDMLARFRHRIPETIRSIIQEMRRVRLDPTVLGDGELDLPPRILRWLDMPVLAGNMPLGRLIILRDITEERLLERMQNDLTHTMVHDLRNPLTGISGALKLLQRNLDMDLLNGGQRQMFEIIDSSTQRMLTLVNAILDIGRLESGQMPLRPGRIHINALVSGVLALQTPIATEADIVLTQHITTTSLEVAASLAEAPSKEAATSKEAWGDYALIERVLQNLVGNAIKFTPAGGTVCVSVTWSENDDNFVVSVSDTGAGVPADVQGHLFQKFVTGEQVGRGSGLGLTFCKMVLEAHNQRIWLAETSSAGTTFSFTLATPPT